jgi:hypothetical protein
MEQYDRKGNLALIEVRISKMLNPALNERGYGPLFILYWDIASDIMSYSIRDNHRVKHWTPEEQQFFFYPDFMRRQWYLDTSVKSQAEVSYPDQFFLRPALEEEKFPAERPIQLPPEVAARVQAQEAAGRMVFEVTQQPPIQKVQQPRLAPVTERLGADLAPTESPTGTYAQKRGQATPTALR